MGGVHYKLKGIKYIELEDSVKVDKM